MRTKIEIKRRISVLKFRIGMEEKPSFFVSQERLDALKSELSLAKAELDSLKN